MILQILANDIGASEKLDKEIASQILYGGVPNPKALGHIEDLILTEN